MRKLVTALGLVSSLVCATSAFAGWKQAQHVVISDPSRLANGMLGTVANSANLVEWIDCGSNSANNGWCYAKDSAGTFRSCWTNNANLVNTIRSMNSDSYVLFYWDTSGMCSSISIETSSSHEPKH